MPQVVIKTRDLDTDAKASVVLEIERVPDNPLRQGQQLAELVRERHPEARSRSFADGVASFVSREHLIIACYRSADIDEGRSHPDEASSERVDDQDQLFAA